MRKPIQYKRMVPLLLPVVMIIGVFFFYYHGKALKASAPDSLVSVTVDKKAVPNDSLTTEEEEVELALKAKETALLELPYDDTVFVVPLDEEGQEVAYPQIDSSDFKKANALKVFDDRLKAEQSSEDEKTKEAEANEIMKETEERLPYYQVHKPEGKGSFYFELEKDQVQRVRIKRLTKKEKTVNIQLLKDTTKKQGIVVFKATENLEAVNPIPEIPLEPEQTAEEKTEEAESSAANEEIPSEAPSVEQAAPEKKGIQPRKPSLTEPFNVNPEIKKVDGTPNADGKYDTTNDPGYDDASDNGIVRSFDQVSYQPTMGISNLDDKYDTLLIRIDSELPNAWRKDSSGQVRQTAEFAYGTLVDTGNGTKKSVRSVMVNASKASNQAFTTETLNVYGAVHGDELKPKFKFTIVSATIKKEYGGGSVEINQEVDSSLVPELETDAKIKVSAKPLVDVKITQNGRKNSTFEKATGTSDKPYTMVRPIAAYVKLKTLPRIGEPTSIKGCTYPVGGVEYKINQKVTYVDNNNVGKQLDIGSEIDPIQAIIYDGFGSEHMKDGKYTSQYSSYASVYSPLSLQGTLAPYGKTKRTDGLGVYNLTGVYDTGNPEAVNSVADHSISIKNDDYVPISVGKNKWFFSGNPMGSNDEPFSVISMQLAFPYSYLKSKAGKLDYTLSVSEIKYEGQTQSVKTQELVPIAETMPGDIQAYSAFLDYQAKGLSSSGPQATISSKGDGVTAQGNSLYSSFYGSFTDPEASSGFLYGRWNSNSFQYDESRNVIPREISGVKYRRIFYGVGTSTPDDDLREKENIDSAYSWYASVSEAKGNGKISAVKIEYEVVASDGYGGIGGFIPLKAIGLGIKDTSGNPNIALANTFNYKKDGSKTSLQQAPTISRTKYKPSTYDEEGNILTSHSPPLEWGDTLYIAKMTIRPTISTDKKTYTPEETVKWTADGKVSSGSEKNHKVQFDVTIPKATVYKPGTAKDHLGNPLPDPSSIVQNGDGEWVMKWVLDYMAEGSTYNPKVTFDTSIVSSELNFSSNVANLNGKVVSQVWLEEDEKICDSSDENFRKSATNFTVTNSGVIVVDKVVDKPYIESGNKIDPAKPSITHPTDFTYTISFKNHSSTAMKNVRILDVLPHNDDKRGSKFNGGYTLADLEQVPYKVKGAIWYNKKYVPMTTDPNDIKLDGTDPDWIQLDDTDPISVLKDAKSIMGVYEKLDPGKDMALALTMRPHGQKAGDIYVNAPVMNSSLNKKVDGVRSTVRVYGRDLTGVAWYDDTNDGILGNKTTGGPEDRAKDIPVKLYRTSLEVPSYKKELVRESLTGEEFVTAAGESKVKTGSMARISLRTCRKGTTSRSS